ncbi:MAG: hypothetical protein Q9226_004972 [Calogaya cf. arnoldii]
MILGNGVLVGAPERLPISVRSGGRRRKHLKQNSAVPIKPPVSLPKLLTHLSDFKTCISFLPPLCFLLFTMQWLNWHLYLLMLASFLYIKSVAGLPYPIPQSNEQEPSQACKTTDNAGNLVHRPGCRIESDTVIQELPADIKATEDSATLDSTDQNAIPQHGQGHDDGNVSWSWGRLWSNKKFIGNPTKLHGRVATKEPDNTLDTKASDTTIPDLADTVIQELDGPESADDHKATTFSPTEPKDIHQTGKQDSHIASEPKKVLISWVQKLTTT